MNKKRLENDSIGALNVPENAYYGVQTLRGHDNFQITGVKVNYSLIKNIVRIKKAAAIANEKAELLPTEKKDAIIKACDEILSDKFKNEFITDAIQGGAGTTMNMNVNEVIANRATELLGGKKGEYICHPNDNVNCSQSTNDVIPTAGKLTVLELCENLLEALESLVTELDKKALEFDGIIKMGRTQLQDAVPIRLGQEFKAYSIAIKRDLNLIKESTREMRYLNLGGTAIGTALNTNKTYLREIIPELIIETKQELFHSDNLIESTSNLDGFVFVSGAIKTCAVTLSKMCNDLRLMSSGPRTGLGEITLPAKQNGSSIMPGKVNPVIPEVVSQVAFAVIGNDTTITMAAEAGQLELNAFEPVIFQKLFESITYLSNAVNTLTENCIKGIIANKERCYSLLDSSVGIVTALCPYIGYKKSAELAKEALATNLPVKHLIRKYNLLSYDLLEQILNPYTMTEPTK